MEVVDQRDVECIGRIDFLLAVSCRARLWFYSATYIVGGQLVPLLKICQQRHCTLHRRDACSGDIGHVHVLVHGGGARAVLGGQGPSIAVRSSGRPHRVSLELSMATVGLLLLVVVEGHSACEVSPGAFPGSDEMRKTYFVVVDERCGVPARL